MSDLKVLVSDGLAAQGQEVFKNAGIEVVLETVSAEDLLKVIGEYDALIVRSRTKVTAAVFEAAKGRLKVVGRAGIGVDNIDLEAAKNHGVLVVNSPTATTGSVAELALGMMLGLVRELPRADATMKAGEWIKKELKGSELFGKTLGVIGFGRIGAHTAKLANAFGMSIIAYDPYLDAATINERGGEPVSLEDLYARSDMITLHIPLLDTTRNMLNAETFAKMKKGVWIVCAARGGVIDENALLEALNSGQVAGAALDVFAAEPPGATDLVKHPKVCASPHIGAASKEAQVRAGIDISHEVTAALRGEELRWRVA